MRRQMCIFVEKNSSGINMKAALIIKNAIFFRISEESQGSRPCSEGCELTEGL